MKAKGPKKQEVTLIEVRRALRKALDENEKLRTLNRELEDALRKPDGEVSHG